MSFRVFILNLFLMLLSICSTEQAFACYADPDAIALWDSQCPAGAFDGIYACQDEWAGGACPSGDDPDQVYVCNATLIGGGSVAFYPVGVICTAATKTPVERASKRPTNVTAAPMCGSVVQPETHTVSENIKIVGTPFYLNYTSNRVINRKADRTIVIPVGGTTVDPNLAYIDINIQIAGRSENIKIRNPSAGQTYLYEWNGLDISGQPVIGSATAEVNRTEHYIPVKEHVITLSTAITLSNYSVDENYVGGWSFNIHHRYIPTAKTIYYGDGSAELVASQNTSGNLRVANSDGSELYIFDTNGKHLSTINGLKGTTKYSFGYDSADRLITITDAYNNVTTVARDSSGSPTAITSAFGRITSLKVDANGFLSSIKNPTRDEYKMTYFASGLLHTFTNPKGVVSTMSYDNLDRLISDFSSAGNSLTINTPTGPSSEVTTAEGVTTLYSSSEVSDGFGGENYSSVSGPEMATQSFRKKFSNGPTAVKEISYQTPTGMDVFKTFRDHPRFGAEVRYPNLTIINDGSMGINISQNSSVTLNTPGNEFDINQYTETTTINGKMWTSVYDGATSKYTLTSPLGVLNYVTIDAQERVTQTQEALFHPVDITYDTNGRLSTIAQTPARTTRLFYNAAGWLRRVRNGLNQDTIYTYDRSGRVLTKTLPDLRVISFSYDDNGNLTSVTPSGKPTHDMSYNAFDLLSGYLTTSPTTYAYNNDRQITQVIRPNSDTIGFIYSPSRGRLTEITTPAGNYVITQNASGWDHVQSILSPDGITTAIDQRGDNVYVTQSSGPFFGKVTTLRNANHQISLISVNSEDPYELIYNDDSQLIAVASETIERSPVNGRITKAIVGSANENYTYSNFGELSSIRGKYNNRRIYSAVYKRDDLGRIKESTERYGAGVEQVYEYFYDPAGRLTEVKLDGVVISTYTYDSNNNRLSVTKGATTITGTYSDYDQLLTYGTKTYTYNSNGELIQSVDSAALPSGVYSYSYDTFGNLKTVTLPNTDVITYMLDGLNRRAGVKLNGVLQKQFAWQDQLKVIAELDPSNTVIAEFIYGTRVNVPDYMKKNGELFKIMTNHLGSVVAVVNTSTGVVAQEIRYDEFGNITSDTSPGFQPFGYAGGLYDPQTKLVHFNAREYDTETGRWLSKDPILFSGGDTNLYGYVMNDPVNGIDPTGTTEKDLMMAKAWINKNRSQLVKNINPKVILTPIPFAYGLTPSKNLILLDMNELDRTGCEGSSERVGSYVEALTHELIHANLFNQYGFWKPILFADHDKIESAGSAAGADYQLGKGR